jgi:hypothetical protein
VGRFRSARPGSSRVERHTLPRWIRTTYPIGSGRVLHHL